MKCKKCNENKLCKIKGYTMKCNKCSNEQFYTRRKNHVPTAYVCGACGKEIPIKNKKEKEIKEAE